MPIIAIIFTPIIFLIFFYLAPKPLKILMKINLWVAIIGFVSLTVLSIIFDAGKAGANEGMLEDESFILLFIVFIIPITLALGIIYGLISRLFANR